MCIRDRYSSVREEYRPLKPENVLPEFLLLYRLAPAKDKTHVDAPALSGGAALALDIWPRFEETDDWRRIAATL